MQQQKMSASISARTGDQEITKMLGLPGLEKRIESGRIVEEIDRINTLAFIDLLGEYAESFPASRAMITEAFDTYIKLYPNTRMARRLSEKAARLLALQMLEAIG